MVMFEYSVILREAFCIISSLTNELLLIVSYHIIQVTHADFKKAKDKVMFKKKEGVPEGLYM